MKLDTNSGARNNVDNRNEIHIKLRSKNIRFCVISLLFNKSFQKFAQSIKVVLCAKLHQDSDNMDINEERDFARFQFKSNFDQICNSVTSMYKLSFLA